MAGALASDPFVSYGTLGVPEGCAYAEEDYLVLRSDTFWVPDMDLFLSKRPEEHLADRAQVAVLLEKGWSFAGDELRESLEVVAEADLTFFEDPRKLLIIRLALPPPGQMRVVDQLSRLEDCTDRAFRGCFARDGPRLWPLHDLNTCLALTSMATFERDHNLHAVWDLQRLLQGLRLYLPTGGAPLLHRIRDHYGSGQAYSMAWSQAYTQMLWILGAAVAIFLAVGGHHPAHKDYVPERWEVLKVAVVLWGFAVLYATWRRDIVLPGADEGSSTEALAANPGFRHFTASETWRVRLLLAFGALPVTLLSLFLVAGLLFCAIQFQAYLIWDWGDCIHLGCRDPQEKHAFLGWLAEVSSDVMLAVIFEGLLLLSRFLGEWVARLENYQLLHHHRCAVEAHTIVLEALGKIFPFVALAIVFVPQWTEPVRVNPDADCSDLHMFRLIGPSAFQCLRRRVTAQRRREIFKLFMKGPFFVAPFISILMKAIVPFAAQGLDFVAESSMCCCRRCGNCGSGVARLLGLIFAYDADCIGGTRYVLRGSPFGRSLRTSTPRGSPLSADMQKVVSNSLRQSTRKVSEARDELLDMKLSFLWVLTFAPVMPSGVLPTLGARLLESRADLTKMLWVRRRAFPEHAGWLHATQRAFVLCVCCFGVAWSATLTMVTYNDTLWHLHAPL